MKTVKGNGERGEGDQGWRVTVREEGMNIWKAREETEYKGKRARRRERVQITLERPLKSKPKEVERQQREDTLAFTVKENEEPMGSQETSRSTRTRTTVREERN